MRLVYEIEEESVGEISDTDETEDERLEQGERMVYYEEGSKVKAACLIPANVPAGMTFSIRQGDTVHDCVLTEEGMSFCILLIIILHWFERLGGLRYYNAS
jgi:hypothetical protein